MPLAREMGEVASGPSQSPGPCEIGHPGTSWAAGRGQLTVFRPFRDFLAQLDGLGAELRGLRVELSELCAVQKELGPARERMEQLETSRHQFEALCEGLLLKAEGKLRAANNAEARERANKRSYEHLLDPLAEDGVEVLETTAGSVRLHDDASSEEERLQAMRLDVAPSNKTLAQRAKFGVR